MRAGEVRCGFGEKFLIFGQNECHGESPNNEKGEGSCFDRACPELVEGLSTNGNASQISSLVPFVLSVAIAKSKDNIKRIYI
jgi:hypothetical protein